jgi:superfamily II DNA or RNA helicase
MELSTGSAVRHKDNSQLGLGTLLAIIEVAGQKHAYVRWPSTPGGATQHALSDLIGDYSLVDELARAELGPSLLKPLTLRLLGRWFESRHALTGELCNQPFQMLPHQVLVANKFMQSSVHRWLVADDVGLGKTIEAGMIMEVMRKRLPPGLFRCLVVAPAGLARQWQEEMRFRFGRNFLLFNPLDINMLTTQGNLIASVDTLKGKKYLEAIASARPWDLVIFDEAHHLATDRGVARFKLGDHILNNPKEPKARTVLFLTATPHSGKPAHFHNMVWLLRPDLFPDLESLNAGQLNKVMLRNRKSDVTDMKGKRLFLGVKSSSLDCRPSREEVAFFKALVDYLRGGYKLADQLKGQSKTRIKGQAVGFLMTIFRKLASSSPQAIRGALEKRRDSLQNPNTTKAVSPSGEPDDRYEGEEQERQAAQEAPGLIKDELEQINTLLELLNYLGDKDTKRDTFLRFTQNSLPSDAKLLVFTEYRGTQELLVETLKRRFGADSVDFICGDLGMDSRRQIVERFNTEAMPRFLVSTEAGGEGLNLQQSCHVVVNYDLPWNPVRLQQRIGRVYRYGQKKPVQVWNLKLVPPPDDEEADRAFVDGRVFQILEDKIEEIAASFAQVQGGEPEDVRSDVLGMLSGQIDVDQLYQTALDQGLEAMKNSVDRETGIYRDLIEQDKDQILNMFRGLKRFDLSDYQKVSGQVENEHLDFFVQGYLSHQGVRPKRDNQGLLSFRITEELDRHAEEVRNEDPSEARDPLEERVVGATVDKSLSENLPKARLLRFGDLAFDAMVRHVQSAEFSKGVASLKLPASAVGWKRGTQGLVAVFNLKVLKMMGNDSVTLRDELAVYAAPVGGEPKETTAVFSLLLQAGPGPLIPDPAEVHRLHHQSRQMADSKLASIMAELAKDYAKRQELTPQLEDYALCWLEAE